MLTYYAFIAIFLSACGVIAAALEGENLRQVIGYGFATLMFNAITTTIFILGVLV